MRTVVAIAVIVLGSSCSLHGSSSDPGGPVKLTVEREVPMHLGNLVQIVLRPGDVVEATCFAPAPGGYPGPVVKVRSGPTVGYAVVEGNGVRFFDVLASELRERLPGCGRTGLM